jgi:hypothetical protein
MMLAYVVDRENRIVSIDGPWDEFARANDAPGLTRESVIGRPLFDYVAGTETRELVGLLLERARKGPVLPVPFRCDSPSRRRFLRLDLRGDPSGSVRCESILEREEERPARTLLDAAAARGEGMVVLCSWCKKVRLGKDRWVEVDEAVDTLQLFEQPTPPHLSHGICEACGEAVRKSWGREP